MTIEDEPGAEPIKDKPALKNPAVARCCAAATETYRAGIKLRNDEHTRNLARDHADEAYQQAMPPLSGAANIRDFIACVTYGLLIDTIHPMEASRLLYAAQVAGTLAKRSRQRKPKKSRPAPVATAHEDKVAQKSA